MALHAKGHSSPNLPALLFPLLLLLLLPSLVVSGDPKQARPANEPPSIDLLAPLAEERQARSLVPRASIVGPSQRLLIARPTRSAAGAAEGTVGAPHQQSTNAAATRRERRHERYARPRQARGAEDSMRTMLRMIIGDADSLSEKRAQGGFLPGQINGLNADQEAEEAGSPAFLPPKIVYADMTQLPTPFVQAGQQERGRAFGLSNFLIKDREPMSPRSFGFESDAKDSEGEATAEASPSERATAAPAALTPRVINEATNGAASEGYSLFHRIVAAEAGSADSQSFEANSVAEELREAEDEDPAPAMQLKREEEYDGEAEDWDTEDAQLRDMFDDFENDAGTEVWQTEVQAQEQQDSRYEFGYRVIDRATGSDFGHQESRPGQGQTTGRYHVLLPDGRVQRVEYRADRGGYHADITYERSEDTREPRGQ